MKKLLVTLSALVILGLPKLMAQIPNPDFATWTDDAADMSSSIKDPNTGNGSSGWWDFNMFNYSLLGGSPVTVFPDSVNPTPYNGSRYSAKIISATMTATSYGYISSYGFPQTNGLLLTGYINVPTFKTGIPWNQNRINTFSFYYRYIPKGVDTCSCSVTMFHYSSVTHKRDVLGAGTWSNYSTVSSWTMGTINMFYDSATPVMPDTVLIVFSACSLLSNPKAGDTMNVDNMGATLLGVNDVTTEHDNVNLYPNPANDEVNLAVTGQYRANSVEVYDITGKSVGTYTLRNNFLTINTEYFNSGLYLYKLLDNNGVELNIGKFSVVR